MGAQRLLDFLEWCDEPLIPIVTIWFLNDRNISTRPPEELEFIYTAVENLAWRIAGARRRRLAVLTSDATPSTVVESLRAAAAETLDIDGAEVVLALDGGRPLLIEAVKRCMELRPGHDVTHEMVAEYMAAHHQPDIDLVIRPSGVHKLSATGLWQAAWAELYTSPPLWPDFTRKDLDDALAWYGQRKRYLKG